KAKPEIWKKNIRKKKRNSGKAYTNTLAIKRKRKGKDMNYYQRYAKTQNICLLKFQVIIFCGYAM
ncbi:hypothetical protein L9F63_001409, partial [Diploptera punctata]